MPARNRQPPRGWWTLSPAQLVGDVDDSDDEEADIAQYLAASSPHPRSFADALCRTDTLEWRKAVVTELDAHKTNGTWILVPHPKN
jgi:glutathione S-transferase